MSEISYCCAEGVGTIELNRPPANSYHIDVIRALDATITSAEADPACRVVVLRSALPGFFCGGADIKRFLADTPRQNMDFIALAHETLSRMGRSEKIYIAEIAGHALGGGLELALTCDLRFAAKGQYRLGLPEVTLGILPGNGGTQRLPALVGISRALEMMITGMPVSPEEAHRIGLVNRLYDVSELAERTTEFARGLAASATFAVGKIKRSVWDGNGQPLEAGLASERHNIGILFNSADAVEGFAAFTEKRKARFSGR
ncbi:MAG: short chain enoyl-CoA hydratase [Alphaproteobacteria bacterium]|nr:short chain enoyl-CoA hydratase [Alphaproteobacteria bacterium]